MFTFLTTLEENFGNYFQRDFRQQGKKSIQDTRTKSAIFIIESIHKNCLQKHMVRKHYYNFRYITNMLKIRSCGFDRAQQGNVNQIQ